MRNRCRRSVTACRLQPRLWARAWSGKVPSRLSVPAEVRLLPVIRVWFETKWAGFSQLGRGRAGGLVFRRGACAQALSRRGPRRRVGSADSSRAAAGGGGRPTSSRTSSTSCANSCVCGRGRRPRRQTGSRRTGRFRRSHCHGDGGAARPNPDNRKLGRRRSYYLKKFLPEFDDLVFLSGTTLAPRARDGLN